MPNIPFEVPFQVHFKSHHKSNQVHAKTLTELNQTNTSDNSISNNLYLNILNCSFYTIIFINLVLIETPKINLDNGSLKAPTSSSSAAGNEKFGLDWYAIIVIYKDGRRILILRATILQRFGISGVAFYLELDNLLALMTFGV